MHSSCILSMLCAAGALAGPVLNERNMAPHRHNHMDFHLHKGRDTGADEMLNWLESNAPAGDFPPAGASTPTPPANSSPPPAEKIEEAPVAVTTITEGAGTTPTSTSSSSSSSSSPPPAPAPVPAVHEKISGPPVAQEQSPPAQESPASSASSSGPVGSGIPSAPTDFISSLSPDDQTYKDLVLVHHNIHRANHSLPALEWNDTLYEYAKESAQTCVYQHTSPIPPYGQNIAAGNAPGNVSADLTNGFYNGEIGLFQEAIGEFGNNSPDMSDFEHWGHATQMLWKSTTSVGCYTATCFPSGNSDSQACGPDGQPYLKNTACGDGGVKAYFLVCDYYPPGEK